jgi:DNA-binding MarR family transcriptional regulator
VLVQRAEDLAAAVEATCDPFLAVAARALLAVQPSLTASQLRALVVLRDHSDINLGGLAARLGVRPPTATQLCDRLEAAGLLDRRVAGHSRREIRLRLTPLGRKVLRDFSRYRRRDLAAVLDRMSLEDRQALCDGLVAFSVAVDEPDGERPAPG